MTPPYLPQRLEGALTSLLSRCCIWQVAIILPLIELSECLHARSQVGLKEWFQWVKDKVKEDTWVKLLYHSLAFYTLHFSGQTLILSQLSDHAHIFLIQKVYLPLTPDHRFQLYFHSLSVVLHSLRFFSQVFKISQSLQYLITVIVEDPPGHVLFPCSLLTSADSCYSRGLLAHTQDCCCGFSDITHGLLIVMDCIF